MRALLVRDLAPVADRQIEGEQPDDAVDEATRDEPRRGKDLEGPRVDETRFRPSGLRGAGGSYSGMRVMQLFFPGSRLLNLVTPGRRELGAVEDDELLDVLALVRAPADRHPRGAAVEHELADRVVERRLAGRTASAPTALGTPASRASAAEDRARDARAGQPDDPPLLRCESGFRNGEQTTWKTREPVCPAPSSTSLTIGVVDVAAEQDDRRRRGACPVTGGDVSQPARRGARTTG